MATISTALSKFNLLRFPPSSSSRSSSKPARCSSIQQVQLQPDSKIACEPCNGEGWIVCDFCKGQKTNVKADNNRIYRRCPSCRAVGYVLCSKCKVFKCVTFPNYSDGDGRAMSQHSTSWMLDEGLCLGASISQPQWKYEVAKAFKKTSKMIIFCRKTKEEEEEREKLKMEWKESYLDVILVPLGFVFTLCYHGWLWYKVRTQPFTTIIGINSSGRRFWVSAMMKDNEKKNILAVQTLRNAIMGSTLMATTSILLSSGLAAILSSTYSIKKPVNDSVFGAHGEFMLSLKYVSLLTIFLFSFFCHSLSIRFVNQVNVLINTPQDASSPVTPDYVSELLEKGFVLNTVGNRLFYSALPLLLWIFGPVLVFLCCLTMIPILYNLDFVLADAHNKSKVQTNANANDSFV